MANTTTSYKITDNLFLVAQQLGTQKVQATVAPAVNHVAVIDCSGSMYYDLPKIRDQLKKQVPKLLQAGDTLSLIWFSSRGEFGTLLEAEPVSTLTDLQTVNQMIDRWLRPVGLTGFKEPLQEVKRLVTTIQKKNKNPFGLVFMSDGWDNQWNRQEILKAVEDVSGMIASATFVEYGNYADRQLLAKMAEKSGGQLIHSEDFDRYSTIFEAALTKGISAAPKIEVKVKGDTIEGIAFAFDVNNDLLTFDASKETVLVPEGVDTVCYLSPTAVGATGRPLADLAKEAAKGKRAAESEAVDNAYAAVSLYSTRMKPNIVLPLLKALGDVRFIEEFGGCFGKQAYSAFTEATLLASLDPDKRQFTKGWDPKLVPPDDAFTVLDFLRVLSADDSNRLLLDSKDFKYTRIGRPAETVPTLDADGNELPNLEFKSKDEPEGYPVSTLTYNETRPNISVLVKKTGTVDLTARLKGTPHSKVPKKLSTFVFRNYAIVRDGIVNVDRLPVRMTGGTVRALREKGFPLEVIEGLDGESAEKAQTRVKKASDSRPVSFVVNLKALPVINRNMVKEASAKTLFEKQWELTKARATQKVLNDLKKEKFPRESKGFKQLYGEDAAAWLKDQGITDYSGFGPKTKKGEAQDQYVGKELKVALKGLSSLPKVEEAREKIASGKTTARHELLRPAIEDIDEFERSPVYAKAKNKDKLLEAWLDDQLSDTKDTIRELLYEVSQIRFGVVVGQTWFNEFKSLDENTLDLQLDGQKITGTVDMKEIQIEV